MGEIKKSNKTFFVGVVLFFALIGGAYFMHLSRIHTSGPPLYKPFLFYSSLLLSFCVFILAPLETISKDGILKNSFFVGIFLGLMVLINKADILTLPFYWDEQWTIWHAQVLFKNHLWPFATAAPMDTGHPFFYYEVVAIFWKIFGRKILVTHLVGLAFAWVILFTTYLFGKKFFQDSRIGFLSSLLVFYNPLCFSQFGTMVLDVPLTACLMVSVVALLSRRYVIFVIFGSFLALTKAYGFAFVILILLLKAILWDREERVSGWSRTKEYLFLLTPVYVFGLWLLMHYLTTGILLYSPMFSLYNALSSTQGLYWKRVGDVFLQIFFYENKFLYLVIVASFIAGIKKSQRNTCFALFLICFILVVIFAFSIFWNFCPRWLLPVYPFFYLLGTSVLFRLFEKDRFILIKVIIFLTLLYSFGRYDVHRAGSDSVVDNMEYRDAVLVTWDAVRYIERNFPHKRVLTRWPFLAALGRPMLGYVTTTPVPTSRFNSKFDLLVYDGQALTGNDELRQILKTRKDLALVRRFERNHKFIEIYRVEKNNVEAGGGE